MMLFYFLVGVTGSHALSVAPPPLIPPTNGHSLNGASAGLVVRTSAGILRGKITEGIRTWLGVPFAKPPTGDRRFAPPDRLEPWDGVRDAVDFPPGCPQPPSSPIEPINITDTSEDCLYLNIYSPRPLGTPSNELTGTNGGQTNDLTGTARYPVLVWIQSGGFQYNAIQKLNPTALVKESKVLVVPVQHRLGALGFLSLGDGRPVNQGVRDVTMALEWIKRNIWRFGGDSERIVILGAEAGAIIASTLLHSPAVSSMISGAILHSAGPFSPWISDDPVRSLESTVDLADRLKCPVEKSKTMVECLKKVPVEKLIQVQSQLCNTTLQGTCFAPVIDDDVVKNPRNVSRQIQVPVLMGVNNNEGFLKMMKFLTREFPSEKLHSEGFSQEMYQNMLEKMFPRLDKKTLAVLEFLYSSGDNDYSPTLASARFLSLEKIVGDYLYTCGQDVQPDSQLQYNALYKYRFVWRPSSEAWPSWSGVKQGADLHFLLADQQRSNTSAIDQVPDNMNEVTGADARFNVVDAESELSKRMIRYWTNFIYTGSPNTQSGLESPLQVVEWPKYEPFTRIEVELSALGDRQIQSSGTLSQRCNFWNKLVHTLTAMQEECIVEENTKQNEINDVMPRAKKKDINDVRKPRHRVAYKRTVRGLNRNSNPRKFRVKALRKVPSDKKLQSSVKVLAIDPRQSSRDFPLRQNNSKVSYQLSVGLNKPDSVEDTWTVYDTKSQGNSPIYIAPNKYTDEKNVQQWYGDSKLREQSDESDRAEYQAEYIRNRNPYEAQYQAPRQTTPVPQDTRNTPNRPYFGAESRPYYGGGRQSYYGDSPYERYADRQEYYEDGDSYYRSRDEVDRRSSYDPFNDLQTRASNRMDEGIVILDDEDLERSYFPNYIPGR